MKAMILAAGLGTRLRPLTDDRPKALVEIAGRTLLEIALSRLRTFGVREVIINVHHRAEMIVEYLKKNNNFGLGIEISREEILLDTGGGLKKAAYFFLGDSGEHPFIVHNVDVISTIDLTKMVRFHIESQALATLAVQDRESSRFLLFDQRLQLRGRTPARETKVEAAGSAKEQGLAFCGIHVISPRFLSLMIEEGVFSIISVYLRLASEGEKIVGYRADEYYWRDLGKPENVEKAARDLQQKILVQ
jgi:NDP-sugar pyrophosphorylase family protein